MQNVLYGLDPECERWDNRSYVSASYYPAGPYMYDYNMNHKYDVSSIIKGAREKSGRDASEEGKEHVAAVGAN